MAPDDTLDARRLGPEHVAQMQALADLTRPGPFGPRTIELPEARVTLKQAGDFIDRVIANRVLDTALITAPEARDPKLLAKLDAVAGRVLKS